MNRFNFTIEQLINVFYRVEPKHRTVDLQVVIVEKLRLLLFSDIVLSGISKFLATLMLFNALSDVVPYLRKPFLVKLKLCFEGINSNAQEEAIGRGIKLQL